MSIVHDLLLLVLNHNKRVSAKLWAAFRRKKLVAWYIRLCPREKNQRHWKVWNISLRPNVQCSHHDSSRSRDSYPLAAAHVKICQENNVDSLNARRPPSIVFLDPTLHNNIIYSFRTSETNIRICRAHFGFHFPSLCPVSVRWHRNLIRSILAQKWCGLQIGRFGLSTHCHCHTHKRLIISMCNVQWRTH